MVQRPDHGLLIFFDRRLRVARIAGAKPAQRRLRVPAPMAGTGSSQPRLRARCRARIRRRLRNFWHAICMIRAPEILSEALMPTAEPSSILTMKGDGAFP